MRFKSTVFLLVIFKLSLSSVVLSQSPPSKVSNSDLIVLISGFGSDASASQLSNESERGHGNSGMYQLMRDLTKVELETRFFNWNGTNAGQIAEMEAPGADAIVSFVREQNTNRKLKHLVLVGHSWGGHTLIEAAMKLNDEPKIGISLAIGVDPSSLSRGERVKELPSNIKSFVNYHTQNAFVWGPWINEERVENVDLGDPTNRFGENGRNNYASRFDINAHNAAEWDELIHRDIIERIQRVMKESESEAATGNSR